MVLASLSETALTMFIEVGIASTENNLHPTTASAPRKPRLQHGSIRHHAAARPEPDSTELKGSGVMSLFEHDSFRKIGCRFSRSRSDPAQRQDLASGWGAFLGRGGPSTAGSDLR